MELIWRPSLANGGMRLTDTPTNGFVSPRKVLVVAEIITPARPSKISRKRCLYEQILDSYFSDNNIMYFPVTKSFHIRLYIYIYIYIYICYLSALPCRVIQMTTADQTADR